MDDRLIDIKEILDLLKSKLWIILLAIMITTGFGVYKAINMTESYQGSSKIFVGKGDSLLNYYPEIEIKYYSDLMNTFNEVIKIGDLLDNILKSSNIDKTAAEVGAGITITGAEKSPIFTVTYSSPNQDNMKEIINAVANEFSNYIKKMLPETDIKIIDEVRVSPIIPNKKKVIMVAFIVGIIISIGIIFVLDYLDDTIKSKEKLEKLLPIPVLGELPKHEKSFKGE